MNDVVYMMYVLHSAGPLLGETDAAALLVELVVQRKLKLLLQVRADLLLHVRVESRGKVGVRGGSRERPKQALKKTCECVSVHV